MTETLFFPEEIQELSNTVKELKKELTKEVEKPDYDGEVDALLELTKIIEEEVVPNKNKKVSLRDQVKFLAYANLLESFIFNADNEFADDFEDDDFFDDEEEFEDEEEEK